MDCGIAEVPNYGIAELKFKSPEKQFTTEDTEEHEGCIAEGPNYGIAELNSAIFNSAIRQ